MWSDMSDEVKKSYGKDVFDSRVNIMMGYVTGG